MGKYLDAFVKSIPAIQGKKIVGILNEQRQSGSIKSLDEYQDKLRELTTTLVSGKPIPLSKVFLGDDGEFIDSESFNFMLELFGDDLEALFSELNNISDAAEAHRNLISDKILSDINSSLNILEKKIKSYEFLNRSDLGFSAVQYNDFSNDEEIRLLRSEPDSSNNLFFDRGSKSVLDTNLDATVDVLSRALSLATQKTSYVNMIGANARYIIGSNMSFIDVDLPELDIKNIIDNTKGTYWATSILSESIIDGGAEIQLELTLDGIRDVSFIELEPILHKDFYVKRVSYVDQNSIEVLIYDNDIELRENTRINFDQVQAKSFLIEIVQENHSYSNYYVEEANSLYDAGTGTTEVDFSSIEKVLGELETKEILDIIGVTEDLPQSEIKAYAYTIGFDNVRAGITSYKPRGIYVSKKLEVNKPIIVSLETVESYSKVAGNPDFPKGNIEYTIIKRNYDESNMLIDTEAIPMVPFGDTNIKKEYLYPDSGTLIAKLRFRAETGTIEVYKGQELTPLVESVDYTVGVDDTHITMLIATYNKFSIYTVTYTPKKDIYLNTLATAYLNDDNMIEFSLDRAVSPVDHSEVFLKAILRTNVVSDSESPFLHQYKVLVASQDKARFTNGSI